MLAEIPEPMRHGIAAIGSDHRSGSVALTRKAGEILTLLAHRETRPARAFAVELETTCRLLVAAQPAMAPILNLSNAVLMAAEELRTPGQQRAAVRSAVESFLERMESSGMAVSQAVARLLMDGTTVMTHSYSETVCQALIRAAAAGRRLRVIATESRPLSEGMLLAKALAAAGIPVTLIVDALMMRLLPEADLLLVGADAVTCQSFVNKAGTSSLALGAKTLKKRFYALAGSEKFVPGRYELPAEAPKAAAEVRRPGLRNVTVRNLYFDATPLAWITGVVSESGILKPLALRSRLLRMRLHAALG